MARRGTAGFWSDSVWLEKSYRSSKIVLWRHRSVFFLGLFDWHKNILIIFSPNFSGNNKLFFDSNHLFGGELGCDQVGF
jgi:hypothetical protein